MDRDELRDCFDSITPDSGQKTRMLKSILNNRKVEVIPMKRNKPRFIAVAALIAVCIFTATTALAMTFGWHEKLIEYLNPSEAQLETYSGSLDTPNATVTKDGVTFTILQTLTDGFDLFILYEMTVPDEIELPDDVGVITHIIIPNRFYSIAHQPEVLERDGNKFTLLNHVGSSLPLDSSMITFKIRGIGSYDLDTKECTALIDGEWTLQWEFNVESDYYAIELYTPQEIKDAKSAVQRIVISPMSLCLLTEWDSLESTHILPNKANPIVNFKDGSNIALSYFGNIALAHAYPYEDGCKFRFGGIINLDDIESITIDGITIPIG